jgi:hypothetical protein
LCKLGFEAQTGLPLSLGRYPVISDEFSGRHASLLLLQRWLQ